MPAGEYDIAADQGSTFRFHVTYMDSAENAVDLNDYNATMQVRRSFTSDTILLTITGGTVDRGVIGGGSTGYFTGTGGVSGTGGIILNGSISGVTGTTGGIYISVDHVTMKNLPRGRHFYDLELTNLGDDSVTRILKGRFEVDPEVTR